MQIRKLAFIVLAAHLLAAGGSKQETEGTKNPLTVEEIYGPAFTEPIAHKRAVPDNEGILLLPRPLHVQTYNLMSVMEKIDWKYTLVAGLPFSQIGERLANFMKQAYKALTDPYADDPEEKFNPFKDSFSFAFDDQMRPLPRFDKRFLHKTFDEHLIAILNASHALLQKRTAVERSVNGQRRLAYLFDWEAAEGFKKAVGSLRGSEIVLTQYRTSNALKASFELLDELSKGFARLSVAWREREQVEITDLALDRPEEDGLPAVSLAPELAVETIREAAQIVSDRRDYDFPVASSHFFEFYTKALLSLQDVSLHSADARNIQKTREFIDEFNNFCSGVVSVVARNANRVTTLLVERPAKEALASAALGLQAFFGRHCPPDLKGKCESLEARLLKLHSALSRMVDQTVDGTSKDLSFQGFEGRRLVRSRAVDHGTWRQLHTIHEQSHSAASPFLANASSEITVGLNGLFAHAVGLFELYEQPRELLAAFGRLFDVASGFVRDSRVAAQVGAELDTAPHYRYPREPCFALLDHLAQFGALLEHSVLLHHADEAAQAAVIASLRQVDRVQTAFARKVVFNKGHCFEELTGSALADYQKTLGESEPGFEDLWQPEAQKLSDWLNSDLDLAESVGSVEDLGNNDEREEEELGGRKSLLASRPRAPALQERPSEWSFDGERELPVEILPVPGFESNEEVELLDPQETGAAKLRAHKRKRQPLDREDFELEVLPGGEGESGVEEDDEDEEDAGLLEQKRRNQAKSLDNSFELRLQGDEEEDTNLLEQKRRNQAKSLDNSFELRLQGDEEEDTNLLEQRRRNQAKGRKNSFDLRLEAVELSDEDEDELQDSKLASKKRQNQAQRKTGGEFKLNLQPVLPTPGVRSATELGEDRRASSEPRIGSPLKLRSSQSLGGAGTVRRIFVIEIVDCDLCLEEKDFRSWVLSSKDPKCHI